MIWIWLRCVGVYQYATQPHRHPPTHTTLKTKVTLYKKNCRHDLDNRASFFLLFCYENMNRKVLVIRIAWESAKTSPQKWTQYFEVNNLWFTPIFPSNIRLIVREHKEIHWTCFEALILWWKSFSQYLELVFWQWLKTYQLETYRIISLDHWNHKNR